MSSPLPERPLDRRPLIGLVYKANRVLQADMARSRARDFPAYKPSFNLVFSRLWDEGMRIADMAALNGITRQSMGEIVREMTDLGLVELRPDPDDRRAKLVTYTPEGFRLAKGGFDHIVEVEQSMLEEVGEEQYAIAFEVLDRAIELFDEG